jgi:TolA-binding protein
MDRRLREKMPARAWRTRWAAALVVAGLGLAALPAGAQTAVGVRCADHGAYYRVVFDLPGEAAMTARKQPGQVRLEWRGDWELDGVAACRRTLPGLEALAREGEELVLRYTPDALEVRTFALDGPPRWVVDVGEVEPADEGAASSAPETAESDDGAAEAQRLSVTTGGVPLPPAVPVQPPETLGEYRARVQRGEVDKVIAELEQQSQGETGLPPALGFYLGQLYERQSQELDAARTLWETAREFPDHPHAPEALRQAATLFDSLGFHYQASKPLEAYLRHYPLDPERSGIQLRLGRLYALGQDPGAARQELVPLLYQGPEALRPQARLWLAYLLSAGGEYGEAVEQFRTSREQAPDYFANHPGLMVAAGEAELQAGDPETARDLFRTYARKFPAHSRKAEVQVLRGHALSRLEQWRQAVDLYSQVIGGNAQADLKARAQAGIVEALHALDEVRTDAAVNRLVEIANSLPLSRAAWEARHAASRLLAGQERYGEALAQLGALSGQGRPPERRRLRQRLDRLLPQAMEAARAEGKPFQAFKQYNRYGGNRPPAEAGRQAFHSLLALGALKAARRTLVQYRDTFGETIQDKRWEYQLAKGYREAGDPAGLAFIDSLLGRDGTHPWAKQLRLERARLLKRTGRHERLLAYLDAHPGLPAEEALPMRAHAHEALGRPAKAYQVLARWDRRSQPQPLPGPVYAEAGDLASRSGQVYDARDYWRKALEAGVPDWQARQLRVLLGVDALQREDFAGVEKYLTEVKGDGAFARAAETYNALVPLIREKVD